MDHRYLRAMCMAGALLMAIGCDEEPPPPVSSGVDTTATDPVSKPTQVPVNEQIKKPLPLKLIPFSIEAPESWEVVSRSGGETPITMVECPIIGDTINIALGLREAVGGEVLRNMIKRFEKEDLELKQNGGGVTITQKGDIRIVDFRRMPTTASTSPSQQLMDWKITLLYPRGVMHEQYTLVFIGLTVEAYEKNKDFLSQIVYSIKYDESDLTPLPKGF